MAGQIRFQVRPRHSMHQYTLGAIWTCPTTTSRISATVLPVAEIARTIQVVRPSGSDGPYHLMLGGETAIRQTGPGARSDGSWPVIAARRNTEMLCWVSVEAAVRHSQSPYAGYQPCKFTVGLVSTCTSMRRGGADGIPGLTSTLACAYRELFGGLCDLERGNFACSMSD